MQKEEILEKSREENKNQDVFEMEVQKEGGNIGAFAAGVLATVFFVVQIFTDGGMNYGLYAVILVIPAARFTVKAMKLKRRHEILVAAVYCIATLAFSAAHIYQLITACTAL